MNGLGQGVHGYFAAIPLGWDIGFVLAALLGFFQLLFEVAFTTTFHFGLVAVFAEVFGNVLFVVLVPGYNSQPCYVLVAEA